MQFTIPIKKRRPMPTFGIYDGGPNAENFIKVGERAAAGHDEALAALGFDANQGHVYAICGSSSAGETSTMVFRRAHCNLTTVQEVTAEPLATFRTLLDEAVTSPPPTWVADYTQHAHTPLTRPFGH